MKKITIKGDFGICYLHKDFYKKENIVQTINIYQKFIESKILKLGNYYVIEIKNKSDKYSTKTLISEILNYICGLEFENLKKY